MVGAIYGLVALGLNIVFNATGAVNFAQGEFAMLGGMLGASILSATGLPLALVVVVTIAAVTAVGILMERLIIRPIVHADVLNLIIVTIGASILINALPRGGDFRRRLDAGVDDAYRLFPVLHRRREQLAGTLSGGEQQMLAIGRALMSRPRLLLCDEPSLGLAPLIVQEIMRLLAALREAGTTILLVEQNARMALRAADRAYVLETGSVVLVGSGAELLDNDELKAAYLGG
jgi:ABC-type branched-subunit amino acid transport system ATPase component